MIVSLGIGYLLGIYLPLRDNGVYVNNLEPMTKGEYYGNIINVFVALCTFFAILVALFKESILRLINHPNCKLELLEDGIVEIIDREQSTPQADSYECKLQVHNAGNETANGCEIYVSEILYSQKRGQDTRPIRDIQGKKKLFWDSAFLDIPPKISKDIRLFKISSPNNYGTPEGQRKSEKLRIEFNGVQIPLNNAQKGYWEVKYYMNCKNGASQYFTVQIEWDGSWKNRKTEMNEVLKVKQI